MTYRRLAVKFGSENFAWRDRYVMGTRLAVPIRDKTRIEVSTFTRLPAGDVHFLNHKTKNALKMTHAFF